MPIVRLASEIRSQGVKGLAWQMGVLCAGVRFECWACGLKVRGPFFPESFTMFG